jgi:branched-chain amino acid transport system permease protein
MFRFDLYGRTAYAYSLVVLFGSFLILRRLINSPFGLSLRGIRENARRMPAIGSPSSNRIRTVYIISGTFAGLAGGLLAQTTEFVALDALSFQRSAEILVMLVLGGAGRLYGGLVGALIFMVARDQLADMNPQYWYFWLGLLLIAVIIFLPNGVLGGCARLLARWWRRA